MKKLTNKEEALLKILWRLEKAFVKEIQAEFKSETATLQYPIHAGSQPRRQRLCYA